MKKITFLSALLCASLLTYAQTELVDFSKITVTSWGGSGDPVVTLDAENQTITAEIVATPGWQWGNQVKITLTNVAESGLDKSKAYKLSFTATASTDDCGGVTLKFFDDNQLFYTDVNYLSFTTTAYNFDSGWLKLAEDAAVTTNGTIVFDFGWDPAQTITISNLSFLEQTNTEAIDNVKADQQVQKVQDNGVLYIIRDGVRYTVTGQAVR